MTWSYRFSLTVAVLLIAAGLLSGGCAHLERTPVVGLETARMYSSPCFHIFGQEVRAYRVACPDETEYAIDFLEWLVRVDTRWAPNPGRKWWELWKPMQVEDLTKPPRILMLYNSKVIFTNNRVNCDGVITSGCTAMMNHKVTAFVDMSSRKFVIDRDGARHETAVWEYLGHERIHQVGMIHDIPALRKHRYKLSTPDGSFVRRRTNRDRWLYGVGASAGSLEPRLQKSILDRDR